MRDILLLQKEDLGLSDLLYVVYYIGIHASAIYFFLTAGSNPGFVDETETQLDQELTEAHHRMKQIELQQTDSIELRDEDDEEEENIGFSASDTDVVQRKKTQNMSNYSKVTIDDSEAGISSRNTSVTVNESTTSGAVQSIESGKCQNMAGP